MDTPQKSKKNHETLMTLNGHSITFLLNAHSIWQTASPPNYFANHSWNFYSLLNPVQSIKYQSTLLNVPVAINLPTQPFAHNSLESKHFIAYLIFFFFLFFYFTIVSQCCICSTTCFWLKCHFRNPPRIKNKLALEQRVCLESPKFTSVTPETHSYY